jgi:hypothetical protein
MVDTAEDTIMVDASTGAPLLSTSIDESANSCPSQLQTPSTSHSFTVSHEKFVSISEIITQLADRIDKLEMRLGSETQASGRGSAILMQGNGVPHGAGTLHPRQQRAQVAQLKVCRLTFWPCLG